VRLLDHHARFPALDRQAGATPRAGLVRRMLRDPGHPAAGAGHAAGAGPVLLVANHMSWLDILVMHAARHCRFVSKSDVKHWPLIGTLVHGAAARSTSNARSRRDAHARGAPHAPRACGRRDRQAVFPEGTTGDGAARGRCCRSTPT
jgi:1-acyl-sn-glycerol-3-phosphate acyltransferase